MKAKKVIDVLNERFKDESSEFKLNQYERWRKWHKEVDPNMESSYHNRYRIVFSIEKNGFYDLYLTKRWSNDIINTLLFSLKDKGIKISYNKNYIRIYNLQKDPDITENIIDYLEKYDPIGSLYGEDYFLPKISHN